MQRGLAQLAGQLQCSSPAAVWRSFLTGWTRPLSTLEFPSALPDQQHQQQGSKQEQNKQPPHVTQQAMALLPLQPRLLMRAPSFQHQALRGMAGPAGPSDSVTTENTWPAYRSTMVKRNDLSAALYALILTFGFSGLFNDWVMYPSRVLAMTGFVFFVLYTRKT